MKTLLILITLGQLCQASFKAGQCDQWCKDYPENLYSGGVWMEKEKKCRCFEDFSAEEMWIMRMPYTIKKSESSDSTSL